MMFCEIYSIDTEMWEPCGSWKSLHSNALCWFKTKPNNLLFLQRYNCMWRSINLHRIYTDIYLPQKECKYHYTAASVGRKTLKPNRHQFMSRYARISSLTKVHTWVLNMERSQSLSHNHKNIHILIVNFKLHCYIKDKTVNIICIDLLRKINNKFIFNMVNY